MEEPGWLSMEKHFPQALGTGVLSTHGCWGLSSCPGQVSDPAMGPGSASPVLSSSFMNNASRLANSSAATEMPDDVFPDTQVLSLGGHSREAMARGTWMAMLTAPVGVARAVPAVPE